MKGISRPLIAFVGTLLAVAVLSTVVWVGRMHAQSEAPAAENPPAAAPEANDRHRLINKSNPGAEIDIDKFIVPGKINIFDFYSKYCGPCMRIGPELEKLAAQRTDVVVNKIDINRPTVEGIDWQSPVARQYKLDSIPHFIVVGTDGKKTEGDPASDMVINMLKAMH